MEDAVLINQLYSFMFNSAILCGVPLIIATILGLFVSILQAVTQIQDQSLPQTIKIVAIAFIFLTFGSLLAAPFFQSSVNLFSSFHKIVS